MIRNLMLIACFIGGISATAATEGERDAITNCLNNWKKHPFGKSPPFRIISGKVRVLGAGGEIEDRGATPKPELILIKPNVTVLSKTTLRLMNPNGWYCLKGRVSVLGKTEIDIDCKASLTSSEDGATVLGGGEQNGVTVLGSSRINRVGCTAGEVVNEHTEEMKFEKSKPENSDSDKD